MIGPLLGAVLATIAWVTTPAVDPPAPPHAFVYCLTCPAAEVAPAIAPEFLTQAVSVIHCESTWNHRAKSNPPYVGLLQVDQNSAPGVDLTDPATNLLYGWFKWRVRGWQPWPHCGKLVKP